MEAYFVETWGRFFSTIWFQYIKASLNRIERKIFEASGVLFEASCVLFDPRGKNPRIEVWSIGYSSYRFILFTDDCNIWRLVNDASLRPIGTCEWGGKYLQPPVSFKKNISTWRKFLFETLKDASVAPETCFISEPQEAQMTFAVGQRLEAVDRKNEALIYPATVVKVTEKELFIHFDGWNSKVYDYWCNRNSRDLFPVGWCHKNHHPLQLISEDFPWYRIGHRRKCPSVIWKKKTHFG